MRNKSGSRFEDRGSLGSTPLPLLLAQVLHARKSGKLHIRAENNEHWIYFENGIPSQIHYHKSSDYLGALLRDFGYIDDATFNESLVQMAQTRRRLGEVLVSMGKLTEGQLQLGLTLQVRRKLIRLFAQDSGQFRFSENEALPPTMTPFQVNPYNLIYLGIKNTYGQEMLAQKLAALDGSVCRLSAEFAHTKHLFEFTPEDLSALAALSDFTGPEPFVQRSPMGTVAARMLLLTLYYSGMLELREKPQLPSPAAVITNESVDVGYLSDNETHARKGGIEYEKALVYFRKRDYPSALQCIRLAVEMQPNSSDYKAFRVWVEFHGVNLPEPQRLEKAREDLTDILASYPCSFLAAKYLSKIYQKVGDAKNHERWVKKAYLINSADPENREALRLLMMKKKLQPGKK